MVFLSDVLLAMKFPLFARSSFACCRLAAEGVYLAPPVQQHIHNKVEHGRTGGSPITSAIRSTSY